ncbi:HEAT repeat domain-containing protein [Candidatus Uabimicrobium sp. HlEnr_7]|uniref:HEAT repeat domain-containing protein n=1 Tax=Candidatus Uabimicrobium helgolandensis TaxID=3095367 RepID=UPI003558F555
MKRFFCANLKIVILVGFLLSNVNAQEKAFVYIKSSKETEKQLQKIVSEVIGQQYFVSRSSKMYTTLKKHHFLQNKNSKKIREKIFKKNVALILLVKCQKTTSGYKIYSRVIKRDKDIVLREISKTPEEVCSQFSNYLTTNILATKSISILSVISIIVNCLIITSIFIYSLFLLVTRGKIVLSLCILQLVLFLFLFVQIYYLLGSHHFEHGSADPYWYQWILFMFFHIFRAIDIIDFLEEFNIGIYFLKHHTHLCGTTIVVMRLMIDAFVIALTVKFLENKMQGIYNALDAFKRRWKNQILPISITIAVVFLGTYVYSAASERWFLVDALLLWPLDNFLRVIDIGDCFQTFNWTLHFVFDSTLHSSMEVLFRFAVGVYIAKWVDRLTTIHFKGIGLTIDEIIDNLENKDLKVVKIMLKKLKKIGPEVKEKAIPRFIKIVTTYQIDFRIHKTLRKEYIFFDEDVPHTAQNNLNFVIVKALQEIDKNGKELCKYFEASDPNIRESAAKLLSALGKRSIEQVIRFLEHNNPNTREQALLCLDNMTSPQGKWCHTREYLTELPIVLRMLHSFDIEIRKMALGIIGSSKVTSSIAGNAIPIVRKMQKEESDKEIQKLCQDVVDIYKGICFDENGNYICY